MWTQCVIHAWGNILHEVVRSGDAPFTSDGSKESEMWMKSYWYAYENNLVVVHPSTEELAHKVRAYILNPKGSDVVPPEYLNQLRKELKKARRAEAEAQAQAGEGGEGPQEREPCRRRPGDNVKSAPLELRNRRGRFCGNLAFSPREPVK